MDVMPTPGGGVPLRNPYTQAQQLAASQALANSGPAQAVVALAAQRTAAVVQQTQTFQAPQATSQTEAGREGKSATGTAQATDTGANALGAVTGRSSAAARQGRGQQLDVSV